MPTSDGTNHSPPAPVARVVLRHPDHGNQVVDIPLLIDSGADATLLPASAVERLDVVPTEERYQLVAFDGTISDSATVRVDLVFLGRRFRGRYFLIDAEVGVLGRDVLSHLRVVLDGPDLRWEEHH